MPEVPTYRNIPTPGFTRSPQVQAPPGNILVPQALQKLGGALTDIGLNLLADFKKKQEISQYSTAQTDAIVAMNNLQEELLSKADYTKHEELAIETKDSIRKDAMRGITEPEAQAAFDRWFNKAYEQLEQSVVVNAIGAGKRKFQADTISDLEKASLMPLEQGRTRIEDIIAGALIAGVPQEILIGLQDDALHDLQLNDLRRATNIKTAQAQEDFGAIEAFINEAQESTRYAKLDANDWASVKSQAKSDFNFNKSIREDAEKKARAEAFEGAVDDIFFKQRPNMGTALYVDPKYDALDGHDKLQLQGIIDRVGKGEEGDGVKPEFVDPGWESEYLELSVVPGTTNEDLRNLVREGFDDGLLGTNKFKQFWDDAPKRIVNQALIWGTEQLNKIFNDEINAIADKDAKRFEKRVDALRIQKVEANNLLDLYIKSNPNADPVEITKFVNGIDKIYRDGKVKNNLIAFDTFLNETMVALGLREPTVPVEPEEPAERPGGRVPAEPLPEPKTNNAKREEFERLTGVKLSSVSGNIDIGTDPITKETYEIYDVGRKSWRWYNNRWQRLTRKGWVDDIEGPEPK